MLTHMHQRVAPWLALIAVLSGCLNGGEVEAIDETEQSLRKLASEPATVQVYRPATGTWFPQGGAPIGWGLPGDIPVPADYNGDGRTDVAIYRPSSGQWFVRGILTTTWGIPNSADIPVPGDYNGDGATDIAIYRPSSGQWFVRGILTTTWGIPNSADIPVPGDYNGDGATDIAIYRPESGQWFVLGIVTEIWGEPGDVPIPGDYNGDGATDIAIYRPATAQWFVRGIVTLTWGNPGSEDVPLPGDYNGDGTTDITVFRPSSAQWFVRGVPTTQWGEPRRGDIPVPRMVNPAQRALIKLTPPPPRVALGVMAGQNGGDGGAWETATLNAVHSFERQAQSKPKLVHMFSPMFNNSNCVTLPTGLAIALREGYSPMLSWSFLNYGGSNAGFDYAGLLAGSFDACIRSFARQAKALNSPLILRPFWEMNGDWFPWGIRVGTNTPQRHVQAFQRMVNLFRAEGADNVKFAWCPNNRFGDPYAYASYYPSDTYVDYLCLDGYNWGTAQNQPWSSFEDIYGRSYAEITALGSKPLIIGEYATHTAPGDKAAWIVSMRNSVNSARFSRIKVLTWFNRNQDGATWQVDSSPAALDAYKALAADPYFSAAVP